MTQNAAAANHELQNVKRHLATLEQERETIGEKIDALDDLPQWGDAQRVAHEKLGEQYDGLQYEIDETRRLYARLSA